MSALPIWTHYDVNPRRLHNHGDRPQQLEEQEEAHRWHEDKKSTTSAFVDK